MALAIDAPAISATTGLANSTFPVAWYGVKADTIPTHAAPATFGEPVLVEVRLGQYAKTTILAYETPSGMLLLPVAAVLSLAHVSHREERGTISGRLYPRGTRFELDAIHGIVRRGRERWRTTPDLLVATSSGVHASLSLLARVLGVTAEYDRDNTSVEVSGAENLPVGVRALHSVERLSASAESPRDAATPIVLRPDRMSPRPGFVIDYNIMRSQMGAGGIFGITNLGESALNYTVGVATPIAHGSLLARMSGDRYNGAVLQGTTWTRAWPEGKVTKLELGDVFTQGIRQQFMRGVAITNFTLVPRPTIGTIPFSGDLPAGWTVAAFRENALVGVDSVLSDRYSLTLPVQFGTTTVDFVAMGPSGEMRTFQRSFHTPTLFVQPRHLEYAVAAGACTHTVDESAIALGAGTSSHTACMAGANADIRYGLSSNWVIRSGIDYQMQGTHSGDGFGSSRFTPYIGIAAVPKPALTIDAAYAPPKFGGARAGVTVLDARFEPSPSLVLATNYTESGVVAVPDIEDTIALVGQESSVVPWRLVRRNYRTSYGRFAPRMFHGGFAVDAWESVQWWENSALSNRRVGLSFGLSMIQAHPYLRRESNTFNNGIRWGSSAEGEPVMTVNRITHRQSYFGLDAMLLPAGLMAPVLGHSWLHGMIETTHGALSTWDVSLEHPIARWHIAGGMHWRRINPGVWWTLSIVSRLPQLQASVFSSSAPRGQRSLTTQSVRGTVLYDGGAKRFVFSAEPGTERGGFAGVVFLDLNANGRRDSGEPPVASARLWVGNQIVSTDSVGQYRVWGVEPYAEVQVSVDTLSLTSPWWVPLYPSVIAHAPINGLVTMDVPIVVGGIVQGTVSRSASIRQDDSGTWTTPPRVVLTRLATGEGGEGGGERQIIDCFTDGTFYREGMRPGIYAVSVDVTSLESPSVVSDTVVIRIGVTQGDPSSRLTAPSTEVEKETISISQAR